jgi:hypothetical protein
LTAAAATPPAKAKPIKQFCISYPVEGSKIEAATPWNSIGSPRAAGSEPFFNFCIFSKIGFWLI